MVDDPSAAPPRDLVHSLVPPLGVTRGPSDDDCGESLSAPGADLAASLGLELWTAMSHHDFKLFRVRLSPPRNPDWVMISPFALSGIFVKCVTACVCFVV